MAWTMGPSFLLPCTDGCDRDGSSAWFPEGSCRAKRASVMIGRRSVLAGALALAGCVPSPPSLRKVEGPILPGLRLDADASFETWARHLHMPAMRHDPTVLALSGGGEDGAFGAGVLNGWSEAGGRPVFDVVTGVSTGALMAPFAFLGPFGDGTLRRLYTAYGEDDLLRARGPAGPADCFRMRSIPPRRCAV